MVTLLSLFFVSMATRRSHALVRQYVHLSINEANQGSALRASEELLERTGATAGVGGWALDRQTLAMRLTVQACRIHGLPPSSQPGLHEFVQLYPMDQRPLLQAAMDAAMSQAQAFDQVLSLVTPQGQPRWVRLIAQPQIEPGQPVRLSGVVQDITQARQIELALAEKHHLLTLLVETTSEGFWFVDTQAVTTDVNKAMCAILGYSREAMLGRSIFDFVDEANQAIFKSEIQLRARGISGSYEITLTRADGSPAVCVNHATPIFDLQGQRVGSVGMWIDISDRKRAEQQLRATSEQLQVKTRALEVTLDAIGQGIISADADGKTLVYNRRALELLDLPVWLMAPGATFDDLIQFQVRRGDLDPDGGFTDVDGVRHPLPPSQLQASQAYVRRTAHGALIEVRTRQLPGGGMVRTYTDVTAYLEAQRALRESEGELRALLNAFPGFISVIDARQTYTYVNRNVADLLGRTADQIVGRTVREVQGEVRFAQIQNRLIQAQPGQPYTEETEYSVGAGKAPLHLQMTYALGADDGAGRRKQYAVGIDISARKAAEQGLMNAKNEAERANRAKSQFLSNMSHELRTPMNAIIGFGQLLMSDPVHPLAPNQRDQLAEILRGARHLLSLINEVLDLSVVETGKLRVELAAVSMPMVVQQCVGLLRPLADSKQVRLVVDESATEPCLVRADHTRLNQVLLNLLGNAIKYNLPGGQVLLRCTHQDNLVTLWVQDTGPGLTDAQLTRLFDAFERLDADQTTVEGAGLGLALCKGLMHAMQGEIGVESEVGRGSRFWIRLPAMAHAVADHIAENSASQPSVSAPGQQPRQHATVLYIEDNPVNQMLMEAMLDRASHLRLVAATTPLQGLQMADQLQPDVILLDIQLPGIDGFEVLKRLRQNPRCQHIPVIAVSANAMPAAIERGLAAGFLAYLTKPLDLDPLHNAVAAALAQRPQA
jgi:PAS domain S-box-containing protein